jgi:S1-C subfamily serine protease
MDRNVRRIIDVLKRGEEVEYGFLGVSVNLDERVLKFRSGILVSDSLANTPAHRAGIRRGELIVTIDGESIKDHDDLFLNIGAALAGNIVEIETRSLQGRSRKVEVRLSKAPHMEPFIARNRPQPFHGIRVDYLSTLTTDIELPEGVVIREIQEKSLAEQKLKDSSDHRLIVVAVDGKQIRQPKEFYDAVKDKDSVELEIIEAVRGWSQTRRKIKFP